MFIPPVCRCTLLKEIFHYTCTVGGYVIPVWHPRLSLKGIKKWMTWLDSYYGSRQSNKGGMGVCVWVEEGGEESPTRVCIRRQKAPTHPLFFSLFFSFFFPFFFKAGFAQTMGRHFYFPLDQRNNANKVVAAPTRKL